MRLWMETGPRAKVGFLFLLLKASGTAMSTAGTRAVDPGQDAVNICASAGSAGQP